MSDPFRNEMMTCIKSSLTLHNLESLFLMSCGREFLANITPEQVIDSCENKVQKC